MEGLGGGGVDIPQSLSLERGMLNMFSPLISVMFLYFGVPGNMMVQNCVNNELSQPNWPQLDSVLSFTLHFILYVIHQGK